MCFGRENTPWMWTNQLITMWLMLLKTFPAADCQEKAFAFIRGKDHNVHASVVPSDSINRNFLAYSTRNGVWCWWVQWRERIFVFLFYFGDHYVGCAFMYKKTLTKNFAACLKKQELPFSYVHCGKQTVQKVAYLKAIAHNTLSGVLFCCTYNGK